MISQSKMCCWRILFESPLDCKEIQPVHPKGDQSWVFIGRPDAEAETPTLWPIWCEEPSHWERPWCWERLKTGGEGADREWDGWMALPMQWTWIWVSSKSWWWTWKPGVMKSMGLQSRTQLSGWTELGDCSLWLRLMMVNLIILN